MGRGVGLSCKQVNPLGGGWELLCGGSSLGDAGEPDGYRRPVDEKHCRLHSTCVAFALCVSSRHDLHGGWWVSQVYLRYLKWREEELAAEKDMERRIKEDAWGLQDSERPCCTGDHRL